MARLGTLSPAASIAVGIIIGLLSTSIQSIGLTLQRKSHILEDSLPDDSDSRRPPYRRRRWQLGMLMFVIANLVGSSIQITTLPLPVLSTLQASGLVFNTICATLILSEPFTRWSFGGTCLVAGGAVLIALFGALPEPTHDLDQLLLLLGHPQFIVWIIGTGILVAAILAVAILLPRLLQRRAQLQYRDYYLTPRMRLVIGMSFGSVSAILSAHTLLVAKSAVELLVRTIADHVNQFNRWQSWLILVSLICLALSQLYFLHRGLKLCSTSVLYPFVFCVYNIIAILDGLIYFRQTDRLPPLHGGLIALGTFILLAGVLALSWRLDDEYHLRHPTAPPPADAGTLLTPGMGLVEDTTTDEAGTTEPSSETSSIILDSDDEEAALGSSEQAPLLSKKRRALTPTTKDNAILHITKQRRQRFAADADDIWDALMDSERCMSTPTSGARKHARRSSTLTYSRDRGWGAKWESSGSGSDNEQTLKRSKTVSVSNAATEHRPSLHNPRIRTHRSVAAPPLREANGRANSRSTSAPIMSLPHTRTRRPLSSNSAQAGHVAPHENDADADADDDENDDMPTPRAGSAQYARSRSHTYSYSTRRRSTNLSMRSSRSRHHPRPPSRVSSMAEWMRSWWRGDAEPADPSHQHGGDEEAARMLESETAAGSESREPNDEQSGVGSRRKGKRPDPLGI